MSSATSLSGCWAGVCKLPAEVDGASLLTADVGVGAHPELEAGVCVAKIVAAMDCVGPTAMDYVDPTKVDCVGATAADCMGSTAVDCVAATTVDCVGATAVVGAVDVSERCSGLTLSKYFLFLVCVMPLPL